MRRETAAVFCLAGLLASCGKMDPGLEQRLEEVEAERDSLESQIVELKEKQSLLLAKKRDQISGLEKELEEAKSKTPIPSNIAKTDTNGSGVSPRPTPPPPEPKPAPKPPDPKNVIFSDGGVEYFVGSDGIKRRVFRKSDGLAYVRIDGKDRLLPGVENR